MLVDGGVVFPPEGIMVLTKVEIHVTELSNVQKTKIVFPELKP